MLQQACAAWLPRHAAPTCRIGLGQQAFIHQLRHIHLRLGQRLHHQPAGTSTTETEVSQMEAHAALRQDGRAAAPFPPAGHAAGGAQRHALAQREDVRVGHHAHAEARLAAGGCRGRDRAEREGECATSLRQGG